MSDRPGARRSRSHGARAVVMGAGSGIGAAFAVELAQRGSVVVCSDIDETAARRTARMITDRGGEAVALRCEVSSVDDVAALADEARGWFGATPTLVINSPGEATPSRSIGDGVPIEDWVETINLGLWGPIHGCHVFAPMLHAAGHGGLINVAISADRVGEPRAVPISVSQAGVVALTETLAAQLSGTGVTLTALRSTHAELHRSPARIARVCLDAHDRGRLYCIPGVGAKVRWRLRQYAPHTYALAHGLPNRLRRRAR